MNKSTKILTFFNKELRFFFLNDKIAKEIPNALGMTIDKALETNPNLK